MQRRGRLFRQLIPDVDVEVLPGSAGQLGGGVPHSVRDVIEFPGVGYKFGQLDHAKVQPAVSRFPDLCSEFHIFPADVTLLVAARPGT